MIFTSIQKYIVDTYDRRNCLFASPFLTAKSVFKSEGKGGVGGCYQIEITNLGKNIANQI